MRTIPEAVEDIKSILNNVERTEECTGETLVDINELVDEILTINCFSDNTTEIRNKAIDEFAEKIELEISESIIWDMLATMNKNSSLSDTSDKIVDYVVDTAKKIAEQMKGGAE